MDPVVTNHKITDLCFGYIRINEINHQLTAIPGIILKILTYCQGRYDAKYYVQLQSGGDEEKGDEIGYYLLPKLSAKLSGLLANIVDNDTNATIILKQVPSDALHAVCQYLGHHKNIEPDPLPCPVRSTNMSDIVTDQWDAVWIDGYAKKEIFEIILAANYMNIKCLLHLGCAKIATLIKGLSQQEINRVLEEEERYRRGKSANNTINNNNLTQSINSFGGNMGNNNNNMNNYGFNWFGGNNGNNDNNLICNNYGNAVNNDQNDEEEDDLAKAIRLSLMEDNRNDNADNVTNSKWDCNACTFENIGANVLCEMCFTAKP